MQDRTDKPTAREGVVLTPVLAATGPTPPGAPVLVDCDVCDGTQVMTARAADQPEAPATPIPCPRCGGAGVRLVPPTVPRG